jgi:signal transduction histidine kinase
MVFSRPRPLSLGPVDLRVIVNDAVTLIRRDPSARQVAIAIEDVPLTIRADAEMVRAALLNLLINAAQAAGDQGRISVTVGPTAAGATITVRDNGPGIPAKTLERVFEPFFTTKARGGGLGLPIARRTAERHGGSLTLVCPPGGGTVATLSLAADTPPTGSSGVSAP